MALRRRSRQREDESFPGFTDVVRIGAGGFSTVFSAREIEANRSVALKILNVHDVSEHAIGSFQRETFALGTLSAHPHIVTLYRTLATADDRPVLVLELCHGSVWERIRDQGPMAPWDSVAIAVKIAGALETAHRAGMLHRDVKPENVLITQYGEPALADFGVARLQSTSQATAGVFGFTTIHAAPELLEGRDLSAATDVYGLASTLYQLIAGKAAFRSFEDEGPASVILRILRDPVQPLVAEGVPVALSDLLVSSMSKNPYDRPASALELADELRSIEAATNWPDTAYAIEETVAVEQRAPTRPGRFQVRGVDAPWPESEGVEAERPAPPLILTEPAARPDALAPFSEPAARPDAPAASTETAVPGTQSDAPTAPSAPAVPPGPGANRPVPARAASLDPVEPPESLHEPDPASETVFMRSGPGRVEVPRQERRVLAPQGRPAPAPPVPIRPAPRPAAPPPPGAYPPPPPPPVVPESERIEVVFPLAPDPVPIQADPVFSEEPMPTASEAKAVIEVEEAVLEAEPDPAPDPEPERQSEPEPRVMQSEPAAAETGPVWIEKTPIEPIRIEPAPIEPIRIEPAPIEPIRIETTPIEPIKPEPQPEPSNPRTRPHEPAEVPAARDEPAEVPASRLAPTPRFDHLFDEGEERAAITIRPPTPPIGTGTGQTPATWARPRFLSQSFSLDLDDDSNERRTRPTPVVKRTEAPPVPLRTSSKSTAHTARDEEHWTGPPTARGAVRDITASSAHDARDTDANDGADGAQHDIRDDDRSRKSKRKQKRR
ncbi:MAG TPA: protein kinase [Acidimicrobiales bacterium]|nr:protein kinase [Acidimicrobiales bacterium]